MTDANKYTSKLIDFRVLVIGGTSGIGFCVAENLLENGAYVIIASSRFESVHNALIRLRTFYNQASKTHLQGFTVDMGSEESIVELLESATSSRKLLLDHIADTSGDPLTVRPLAEVTRDDVAKAQRVRLFGPLFLGKHVMSFLKQSLASSITFTTGVNSHRPLAGWFLQANVGSGKEGLARGLAAELRPVRVNVVAPGAVETEFMDRMGTGEQLEEMKRKFGDSTLVGHLGQPEDVAEAYVYCMRDGYLTGQTILTEGGVLLVAGTKLG